MKRIIATVALLVSVAFIAKADERPIEVNSMPKAAVEFINSHFAQVPVLLATVDRELMDTDYEVRLEDGTKIDFDGKGRWVEVSNKRVGSDIVIYNVYRVIPSSLQDLCHSRIGSLVLHPLDNRRSNMIDDTEHQGDHHTDGEQNARNTRHIGGFNRDSGPLFLFFHHHRFVTHFSASSLFF